MSDNKLNELLRRVTVLNFKALNARQLLEYVHYVSLIEQRCATLRLETHFKARNIMRELTRELKFRGDYA